MTRARGDALLLIDLQEAFFETRELGAARADLVAAISTLVEAARRAEVPIFLISTEHSRDRSTWTLNMLDDDQGYLFHDAPGTKIIAELDTAGMTRIEKTRDSAWLGTDLQMRLHNLEVSRVAIAGVSAHACITQTARDAYAHNIRATVLTDAVADERSDHRRTVLDLLVADRQADLALVADYITREWSAT